MTTPAAIPTTQEICQTPAVQMPISQDAFRDSHEGFNFLGLPLELRIMVYGYVVKPEWHTIVEEEPEVDEATEMRPSIKRGGKFSKSKMNELWELEAMARKNKVESTKLEKPKPKPRLALRIPNSIPPIHLTCRLLLEETRKYLKPLVVPTRIPRIMFHPKKIPDYEYDLETLLYNIKDCIMKRDYGELSGLTKVGNCESRKLSYSEAIQCFVERTLKAIPAHEVESDNLARRATPLHIVLQSPMRKYVWPRFEDDVGFECAWNYSLAVHIYSMGKPQTPLLKDHEGWFEYKGKLQQESWDADWA